MRVSVRGDERMGWDVFFFFLFFSFFLAGDGFISRCYACETCRSSNRSGKNICFQNYFKHYSCLVNAFTLFTV